MLHNKYRWSCVGGVLMALFTIILVVSTLLNGAFLLAHYWLLNKALVRQHSQVLNELQDFFTSPSDGSPSEFAKLAGAFIEQLSQVVVMRFKTTLMGVESVSSKSAQKVADAVLADSSPVFSALSSIYPSLGKILRKNPGALASLAQIKLPGMGGNGHIESAYNPNKFVG